MIRRHRFGNTSFDPARAAQPAARFVGGIMGFVFGGIGLAVLIFLWSAPFDDFGSPPLFFRVFGSFIAIAFVAMGGGVAYTSLRGTASASNLPQAPETPETPSPQATAGGYKCPNCGAPLDKSASVSPLGDVKCPFCHSWFNVHQRASV
jgi:hypothetical protein